MNKEIVGKNVGAGISNKKPPTMPALKNYNSRTEWESACWGKVLSSKDLLELLVTSNERHDLVMRATAVDALVSGKSYKQIGEELWLSPQTISGIKKALTENNYRSYLERSKKERKKKVYSHSMEPRRLRPSGTPHRTKYGTVYIP